MDAPSSIQLSQLTLTLLQGYSQIMIIKSKNGYAKK